MISALRRMDTVVLHETSCLLRILVYYCVAMAYPSVLLRWYPRDMLRIWGLVDMQMQRNRNTTHVMQCNAPVWALRCAMQAGAVPCCALGYYRLGTGLVYGP